MQVVILIGLQGSGKTRFYRSRFKDTHVHVSKDNFRNHRNKNRRQRQLIEEALSQGRSVVVDNTNPTPDDRKPIIEIARRFGAEVVGYFFESNVKDCLRRNRRRVGRSRVRDVVIYVTIHKLRPPSKSDALFDVKALTRGRFKVSAASEPGQ
jgi:predicted kinase